LRSSARLDLAGVGDDPVRHEIDESSRGPAEAIREQRQVDSMVPAEVAVDEEVRRREEPEEERRYEEETTTRNARIASGGHNEDQFSRANELMG
jgi:hypothetical protein